MEADNRSGPASPAVQRRKSKIKSDWADSLRTPTNPEVSSSDTHAAVVELASRLIPLRIKLTREQQAAFETYISTLLFWRARLSLTGATTAVDIVRSHILDSLAVASYIASESNIVDLGSGAGFPGVPLAITCPQASVTLVESRRKRANFLRDVVRRCRLRNSFVIEGRAEDLPPQHAHAFDLVVSRAVWAVRDLLRVAARLLRPGGLVIAMKGPKGVAERISIPGFGTPEARTYSLDGNIERLLLLYRKD